MKETKERCSNCEVFKNKEKYERNFMLGFFCPIKNQFVKRDEIACELIIADNLPF